MCAAVLVHGICCCLRWCTAYVAIYVLLLQASNNVNPTLVSLALNTCLCHGRRHSATIAPIDTQTHIHDRTSFATTIYKIQITTYTYTCTQICSCTYTHTHMHTCTCTYAQTHTPILMHMHKPTHMQACTHARMHTNAPVHILCTCTYNTHARIRTHMSIR